MIPEPDGDGPDKTRPLKVLTPGAQVSHYKIVDRIGAGGMGIVYEAQDTKLRRHVALKFLPPELTRDAEAKERFILEARAASALDHSNICTIYEIDETEDGQMFIAMACYEGKTVRQKIKGGPLDVGEAVDITIEIARGLREAHEKGIVHRDIKPANVIITTKSQAKVMDFGLAKLAGQTRLTKTGSTLGTVAYMSPEQARGQDVDHRTDIWSLGVMLYEMLTGTLPFRGEYEQAVIYSILNEDPEPPEGLRQEIPSELVHVIARALVKDRDDRYQHIGDLLDDLHKLGGDSGQPPSSHPVTSQRRAKAHATGRKVRWVIFPALAVVAVIAAVVLISYLKPARVALATHRQITFTGDATWPSLSPDGSFIAYASAVSQSGDIHGVFVQDLSGGQPLEVFSHQAVARIQWSPDGSELLIFAWNDSTEGSYVVPRLGGAAREFLDRPGLTWSPEGNRFAGAWWPGRKISVTDKVTGERSTISLEGPFTWFFDVDWSPSGDLMLCLVLDGEISRLLAVSLEGNWQQTVLEDSVRIGSPHWSSKGDAIYYLRGEGEALDLMKIRVSPASGEAKGSPTVVQTGLQAGDSFDLSRDNRKMLYTRAQSYSNLWSVKRGAEDQENALESAQLTKGTSVKEDARISPDGRTIALNIGAYGKKNIFVMPVEGGAMKQITFSSSGAGALAWAPDGKEIAFVALHEGKTRVWTVSSSGGPPDLLDDTEASYDIAWAPGSDILYHQLGNRNFSILNLETEVEGELVANDSTGWMFNPRPSPDGGQVAVDWNTYPDPGIWVISLKDSSQTFVATEEFSLIDWSSDGNWIYAGRENKEWVMTEIVMIPSGGGEPKTLLELPYDKVTEITMTPDAKYFICAVLRENSDVWLMEDFDPEVR